MAGRVDKSAESFSGSEYVICARTLPHSMFTITYAIAPLVHRAAPIHAEARGRVS